MFFNDVIEICPNCHQICSKEKFTNKTYYLAEDEFLLEVHGTIGRVVGCTKCLGEYIEKNKKNFLDRAEFSHRDFYIFRKTLSEKLCVVIFIFTLIFRKKERNLYDQQTGN